MSPSLDMPLSRREAMASLLAMLALLMGASDTEAAESSLFTVDSDGPFEQPAPSSSLIWDAEMSMCAHDAHLPTPRAIDLFSTFHYDGRTLRMDVTIPPDPVWVDEVEQEGMKLGSFVFTGNPAAFFDELSSDADGEWLKKELQWAQKPFTWCRVCGCTTADMWDCANCKGKGFIKLTPEEGRQLVEREQAERQKLIDAAWEGCDTSGWPER